MGTKILVSQPKPQTEKSPYFEVAYKYNVELVFRPFIKIEPPHATVNVCQHFAYTGSTARKRGTPQSNINYKNFIKFKVFVF